MRAVGLTAPRRRMNAGRAAAIGAAATVALLLAAFVASNVSASLAQRDLRERWEGRLDGSAGAGSVSAGEPVARLRIASIGLYAVVVEGPGSGTRGPVHVAATAAPGEPGLAAIEGGRLGFGSFFGAIDRLEVGDEMAVQTSNRVVTYRISDVRRLPVSAVDLTSNGDSAILLLIAPASRFGGDERIVVRARAVSGSRS